MNIENLHFFDKDGYELNFSFNIIRKCWEGNVFLPRVSLGLYSSTTVYMMEEVSVPTKKNSTKKHLKSSDYEKLFLFPRTEKDGIDKITFQWDLLNNFVDEIFMFTFDPEYIPSKISSLDYIMNDGPDCNPLIVKRFDTYEIELDDTDPTSYDCRRTLPIHVAFSSPDHHDANTYKRTLILYYGLNEIARITFYAESIEEDERLRIWNNNLGYNIKPEDTIIFKESDIKEYKPNYELLNEKRKELMIEGHNIYPYIGSYKALINVIKFFGYDNLNLIEFWQSRSDANLFKVSQKYTLSKNDCVYLGEEMDLPNDAYKKTKKLALTYKINTPIDEVDLYELPKIKEEFQYTLEEIIIKLFALKKKLNKEFLPSSSRIIDIIGEASYFGIQLLKNGYDGVYSTKTNKDKLKLSINTYPDSTVYITSDKFFNDFVFEYQMEDKIENLEGTTILNNIKDQTLENFKLDPINSSIISDVNKFNLTESEKCKIYKIYNRNLNFTFVKSEDVIDNDIYHQKDVSDTNICSNTEYDLVTKLGTDCSAKIILSNATYVDKTWNDLIYPFKYIAQTFGDTRSLNSFQYSLSNTIDGVVTKEYPTFLKWTVSLSNDQYVETIDDMKRKEYYNTLLQRYEKYGNQTILEILNNTSDISNSIEQLVDIDDDKTFTAIKFGTVDEMSEVFFELPYVGYYDVKVDLYKFINDKFEVDYDSALQIINENIEHISTSSDIDYLNYVDKSHFVKFTVYMNNNDIIINPKFDDEYFDTFNNKTYIKSFTVYYGEKDGHGNYNKSINHDVLPGSPEFTVRIDDIEDIMFDFIVEYQIFDTVYTTPQLNYISVVSNTITFDKHIKVEPYRLDIRGFYYDSRELNIDDFTKYAYIDKNDPINSFEQDDFDKQEKMEEYILTSLDFLTYAAKHDIHKIDYRKQEPGGYDFQMVMNQYLNKYKHGLYNINTGPYSKKNFRIEDYMIQDGVMIIDNVNPEIVNLIPKLENARYIRNGVDVKPYTWIYLTFDYSKIVNRSNPVWKIKNHLTGVSKTYKGKYFTCLLKDIGKYTISLTVYDVFGNKYSIDRNIVVVDETANHKLYTPFKIDYENQLALEDYKFDIKEQEFYNLGMYSEDDLHYYFEFDELKFFDGKSSEGKYVYKEGEEMTGRITLKPGRSVGWEFKSFLSMDLYDKFTVNLEQPPTIEDELYLYLVSNTDNYWGIQILNEDTEIIFKYLYNPDEYKSPDMKGELDLSSIKYILLHNKSIDETNTADFKILNAGSDFEPKIDWHDKYHDSFIVKEDGSTIKLNKTY